MKILLRKATIEDAETLFEWANDPVTRQNSLSSSPIAWETHIRWLEGKLADEKCLFYVAVDEDGIPCGTIRFDLDGHSNTALISYSVAPLRRNNGIGTALLLQGEEKIRSILPGWQLLGVVKKSNEGSVRCFIGNDYRENTPTESERIFSKYLQTKNNMEERQKK